MGITMQQNGMKERYNEISVFENKPHRERENHFIKLLVYQMEVAGDNSFV